MVGDTAVEAETDVGREGDAVVSVQLPLPCLFGIGVKRHFKPIASPATGEIVEGCQTRGFADGQFLAVEKFQERYNAVV